MIGSDAIADLRSKVRGPVLAPGDDGYDAARALVYGGFEQRPGAIVRVANTEDVSRVVVFARDGGHELAVRGGGHSNAGHSTTEGGIVLDLRDLTDLEIDLEQRTAWAQAGLTAGEYTAAAAEHHLATGFGDTGSVGIGGITLGGGIGYLARKHGLTIDDLLEAEIVTADGRVRVVGEERDPDLFWAIRGGGGNFGVATRFRYRLHELPHVVGGMLIQPATAELVVGFMELAAEAPEELSTIANVMPAPPMPFLPEEVHGRFIVLSMLCFAGDDEAGERAIAPFRALAEPLADMVASMPYPQMYPPEDPDYHPTAVARTMFVDRVDHGLATTIVEWLQGSDASLRVAQLRALGGAMARVPADATAFAHRASKVMVNVAAFYEGAEDKLVRDAWVQAFSDALRQDDQGAYVNFLGEEGPEQIARAYPGATWVRLREVKAAYDPTNLFRRNQNIPPAGDR